MPIRYSDMISRFDDYLKVERNFSERTREMYKYELKRFMEYMIRTRGRDLNIEDVDSEFIRRYLIYLQTEHNYKSATISRIISTLKSFFKFCLEQEYLKISPAQFIRIPKQAKKLPVYLVNDELKRLLDAPDRDTDAGLRDYAILVTLGFTGIRRQEMVNANVSDVDFTRRTLKVYGKGAKERMVPLNKWVLDALSAYLERRPITDTEALFVNFVNNRSPEQGKKASSGEKRRLSPRAIHMIVKKYVRRAGIRDDRISPHKLRHTFATLLHMKDVDILEIQKLLGHAAITSTQIYTHTNTEKLKNAVDKLEDI